LVITSARLQQQSPSCMILQINGYTLKSTNLSSSVIIDDQSLYIYIYIFTSIISQIYTQRFSWSALLKGEEISSNSERCSSTGQILDLLPRYHQFESHKPHGYWRFTWSLTSWSMRLISWGPRKLARTPTLIIIIKKFQAKVIY
jgi:hypothetical protein